MKTCIITYWPLPRRVDFSFWNVLCVLACLLVSKFSLFYTVQYGKVQYSTGIYTVQILTFADDSSLTLKATKGDNTRISQKLDHILSLLETFLKLNNPGQALHDITGQLHYITLHYITLHYITLHYINVM